MHAGRVIFECHARLRLAVKENDEDETGHFQKLVTYAMYYNKSVRPCLS